MQSNRPQTDFFSINTTKIYQANPAGNFSVTSLPLTRRHLQDLESPSHYSLLFDLIANKFSNTPLHRRASQHLTPPTGLPTLSGRRQRPGLSGAKSADAVLTPQRREHQQGRGCTKFAANSAKPANAVPIEQEKDFTRTESPQRPHLLTSKSADSSTNSGLRRPHNSPYASPSLIAARSVGALLSLPEHSSPRQDTAAPPRPSPASAGCPEVVLSRHNTSFCDHHKLQVGFSRSADPITAPKQQAQQEQEQAQSEPHQRVSSRKFFSTLSLPAAPMAPEHPHHLDPDPYDPFAGIGNPHRKTILSPHKSAIWSLRTSKKAARVRAAKKKAEEKAEQRQKEKAEKAAKKIAKENAEAAKRADREQKEAAEKMRKLEKEAEKLRLRREEQSTNMEMKRHLEEEKERIMEVRRHRRGLGGTSRGFDPGAGTRNDRDSGHGSGSGSESGEHHCIHDCPDAGNVGELGFHRMRSGTTWGVSAGGPGKLGGSRGSDLNRR
jgi:hypothetical protein